MKKEFLYLAIILQLCIDAQAQLNYPATKKVNQVDTVFGHILPDPYRWLEDLKSVEVMDWFRKQQDFTDATMANLDGVDSFVNQLNNYNTQKTWWRLPAFKAGNKYYYFRGGRNQLNVSYYYKEAGNNTEHFIFDTWAIHKDKRYNLADFKISPDGQFLLIALDINGEEYPHIKIYSTKAKKWLTDSIPHCYGNTINWSADSKGFIYGMNESDDRFAPASINKDVFKYHSLNTSYVADKIIMDSTIRNTVEQKISDSYFANLYTADSKKRIYCQPNQGFEYEYGNTYYSDASGLSDGKNQWNILYSKSDSVYDFKETERGYYFISGKGDGFKSLRKTSVVKPDFSQPKILLPEDKDWQLESISNTRSFIIANYSKYGFINKIIVINKATDKIVNLASVRGIDRFFISTLGATTDECLISILPVNRPRRSFILNIKNDTIINDNFWAVQNQTLLAGWENIVSEIIEVPSYDGTLIPMSIMRDKNVKLDGNNVCFLNGYGAYGIATKNNNYNVYAPPYNLFMQRGVILVHAYVRGGGEKGESWHRAGMKDTKPNTWKDFIACTEYLIKHKYTQPSKLACTGGSAGGILIGRVITERPDLFAAANIQSGSLNTTRAAAYANGVMNYAEYGNPGIEKEFNGLVEMDATIHSKPNIKYPALYISTGINDPRVAPWMPAKFAATMQANSSSGKPVLLHTNFEGGHFGNANEKSLLDLLKKQLMAEFFMLWQCGHKDFQKK